MKQHHYDEVLKNAVRAELISRVQKARPRMSTRRGKLLFGAGAVAGAGLLAGTSVLVTASASAPPDRFLDASRIITTLPEPQKESDKVPLAFMATDGTIVQADILKPVGVTPEDTRWVGETSTLSYYAAPADGDKICIFDVATRSKTVMGSGCVLLRNFETLGLKTVSPDGKESGWLVVPAGVEKSLKSVAEEPGWRQQGPNFLIRENQ